jgi:DNA-binding beta-propeller fold protein YncE
VCALGALLASGCGWSRSQTSVTSLAATIPYASVHLDGSPGVPAVDAQTGTLYVPIECPTAACAAGSNVVDVINMARCNAVNASGCRVVARAVVGLDPQAVAVDETTDTVYVPDAEGETSVFNGARCNARVTSGCGVPDATVDVGGVAAVVNPATRTLYVADPGAGIHVVDAAVCNAMFVINQDDDTLSALNTRFCDGATTSTCRDHTVHESAGVDQEAGFNVPNSITLVPQTDTAYLVTTRGSDVLAVVNVAHCNATDRTTCRVDPPSLSDPGFEATVDAATDTIYASNNSLPEIDVLDGATCDATRRSGCAPLAEIPMPDRATAMGAIDDTTNTLYASDSFGTAVAVINIATCNATDIAGCADRPRAIDVGAEPGSPVLNPVTHTLYLPFGTSADRIAVINAATCNAEVDTGCGQRPAVIDVGEGTYALGVSATTDTIYAPSGGLTGAPADTVAIISGVACNGTDHSGCGHIAATVPVGPDPYGVAVNDATETVYVVDNADGDGPGTLSMINESACNGSFTAGCGGAMTAIEVGRGPRLVVVDGSADFVYVTDHASAEVSELNGATCNVADSSACNAVIEQAVGSQPFGLAVNSDTNTVYAMILLEAASISVFAGGA